MPNVFIRTFSLKINRQINNQVLIINVQAMEILISLQRI